MGQHFSTSRVLEGSYVAYIAGVEVPVQRVQVQMSVGGMEPMAMIEVMPDPIITRLGAEDRLEVEVFYLDSIYPDVLQPQAPADMRLLFEGEILGWSYTNSARGRRITFTCGNFLRILSDLVPNFITGPESMAMNFAQEPEGSAMTAYVNPINFPWNVLFFGLAPEPRDATKLELGDKEVQRPFDIVQNILSLCTNFKIQPQCRSAVTTNFFARYMKRINFANRFLPSPLLETDILQNPKEEDRVFPLLKALREHDVIKSLINDATQMGTGVPVWAVIQQIFLRMYYEVLAITTAPIAMVDRDPASKTNGVVLKPPEWINDVGWKKPADPLKPNCILNYVTKPQWFFGIAPTCNVLFPSMVTEIHFEENYAQQPTRLYLNDMSYGDLLQPNSDFIASLASMRAGYPEQVQKELNRRYGFTAGSVNYNPALSGSNFLVWPEEFFKGPKSAHVRLPSWFMMLTQSLQITQSEEQKRTVQVIEEIEKYRETDKSNREVYDGVIRLQKEGKLPAGFQISEAAQEDKTELSKALSQLKMVNLGQEALQQTGLDTLRRAYARYEYYRQRSEQRTGTVIMPFNPYIVPGYPMFLFDDLSSGQHIVAYVTNVSHELTTESRNTTVSFINAQTLDEFVHEVFDARVGNTPFGPLPNLCAAPPNPLDTLRDVTQTLPRAEEYFRRLFHQNKEYSGVKSAAFDFTQAFEFVRSTPTGDVIKSFDDAMAELSGPAGKRKVEMDAAEKKLRADYQTGVNKILFSATVPPEAKSSFTESLLGELNKAIEKLHVDFAKNTPNLSSSVLETYTSIRPTEEFADFFKDPIKAYWFVSRPICTLDEYVDFRRRKGMKAANRSPIDSTHPMQGKGGKYYERILDLTPRKGEHFGAPTFDENNNLTNPLVEDLPDMRTDWTTRLITYRNKVILRQFWRSDGEKK